MKCAVCIIVSETVRDAITIMNGTASCREHTAEVGAWQTTTGGPVSYRNLIHNAYPEATL